MEHWWLVADALDTRELVSHEGQVDEVALLDHRVGTRELTPPPRRVM